MQPSQQPRILIAAFNGHLFGMDPLSGRVLWEGEAPGAYPRMHINDAFTVVLGGSGALAPHDPRSGHALGRSGIDAPVVEEAGDGA